ncbi:MAG TPA: S8 family serine peptidase, partial [Ignavibacteriaceae bacterium]|nr:S8 family serine peptidase [Ignavibacteriaceae bacterium]
ENVDVADFTSMLSSDPDIEYIQKAVTYKMDLIPNDSLVAEQWALKKIKAFDAWDITTGSDTVLLAIIDTGIEFFHPDLQNKIFINTGEIPDNNIDDDGNGFVDDNMGWDFVDRVGFPFDSTGGDYLDWDNNPSDDHGHGTLISGIAAAETNNLKGIAGVAPNIKVLNVRSFDPGGFGEEDDAAAAILYSVLMGAKVINMSWGDYAFSYVLRDVIRYAYSQNVVLVAAAGNQGSNEPHYPSGYSEVISVGNSTEEDFVSGNSNWGSTLDLVAPGTSILSTAMNFSFLSVNGTSASSPFVAASAALLLSLNNFTNEEVKQILKSTADDIGEQGWDLRSGSGRLNLFKALSITAPAIIKFHTPTQDFATSESNLKIIASVLSPYFTRFSLEVGSGFNPDNWTKLINNGINQFFEQEIYNLDISDFLDTVYTLRLVVNQNNGGTLEERINFHIDRTPPVAELISLIPSFYGNKSVPIAAMYTNEPCIVRMFYKKAGEDFNFVTLDGFNINNQFVKQLHYGFIPKDLAVQNSLYEIFFEAENLVGLKTVVKDNGNNFIISTSVNTELTIENVLPYTLPSGSIYENPLNITSNEFKNIGLRKTLTQRYTHFLTYENESFTEIDSLDSKIIKDFGDFNNNGLLDLLTYFTYDGYIEEQASQFSSTFIQKDSVVGQNGEVRFWPIMSEDVDSDGITEVFSLRNLSKVEVWDVQSDLKLKIVDTLLNFTQLGFGSNSINSPGAVVADIDGDGIKEFWMVDLDGDIFSYKIESNNTFTEQYTIQTGFLGNSSFLAAGDYNGDGKTELAVLLHSINSIDIAPYYRLIILNLVNNNPNILFDRAMIDASTEFNGAFRSSENSLRFVDVNNDSKDELIVFVFPYSYIFEYESFSGYKIISFKENINSNSIFVGDLNQNGVMEVAFPYSNRIEFSEFATSDYVSSPHNISGYSTSESSIQLNWISGSSKFYIYKGTLQNNLKLIDSTSVLTYNDFNINDSTIYYYAIQAYDQTKPEPLSALSQIIEVYSHTPATPLTAVSNSNQSVIVTFSEKMKNVIENLQSFNIPGVGFPNSISPNNQYSYLLSFRENLPADTLQLIVKDIKDLYNSPITTDTITFVVVPTPEIQTFYITVFQIINPFRIKLVFNYDVDETVALTKENYLFQPENHVSSVEIDQSNKKIIYLNLDNKKPIGSIGKEYRLQIVNLKSSPGTGSLTINSGAGSYVVLTSFAEDLSHVYVYPNPANIEKGKVTFANLPKRAKIVIFTLNGERINEIEEADGNGGVDFNLVYESGEQLNSGIYIFRIVRLDDANNEVEEKIGKFAVIR